ncbi:MAG: branched-chain amino acid transport system substrate-binding protein [Actinomycetota bacterium]
MIRITSARLAAVAAGAALAAVAATAGGAAAHGAAGPVKIGISLSLSGDFSDSGKAARRGYNLWAKIVNAHGGLLGRKVQLLVRDDTSSPTQARTNYESFITKDHVDLVFGPFSTLLSAPSAVIANRYGYAFVEPAGGGPAVFQEKLHNVFFTQPAPVLQSGDVFARFLLSLPRSQRPKTAAYPSLDDPFASPIADRVRGILQRAGVKTRYKTIYPSETTDMTPIVQKVASKHPDAVIGGTQNGDAYAQVKAMVQLKFSPKFLFLTNGPNDPAEFPSKVGARNVNGIFSTGDWFPQERSPGNAAFVKAYLKTYGGSRFTIDPTSAEAYAAGQVIQTVTRKLHSLDNKKIIAKLHTGSWPTVEGVLRWNSIGEPQGSDLLVEWIHGRLYPVFPKSVALHKPLVPKPGWGK